VSTLLKAPGSDQKLCKDGNHSESLHVFFDISLQFVIL